MYKEVLDTVRVRTVDNIHSRKRIKYLVNFDNGLQFVTGSGNIVITTYRRNRGQSGPYQYSTLSSKINENRSYLVKSNNYSTVWSIHTKMYLYSEFD